MSTHDANDSTPVEQISQQLCIADLPTQSRFPAMNMGKRLKHELTERGMTPVQLCALVPDLDIGTLSAIYTRDSRNSKFAPAIALALGIELRWLITGDGEKYASRERASNEPSQLSSDYAIETIVTRLELEDVANNSLAFASRMVDELSFLDGSYSTTDEHQEAVKSDLSKQIEKARELASMASEALTGKGLKGVPPRVESIIRDLVALQDNDNLLDTIEAALAMAKPPQPNNKLRTAASTRQTAEQHPWRPRVSTRNVTINARDLRKRRKTDRA